jgi:DNA ligase-1
LKNFSYLYYINKKIMKENLKVLQAFVDEMKSTSSLNIKKTIINAYGKNPFIKSALVYTFDPYKKYYVTSKTCKKRSDLCDMNLIHDDIFHLLNDLNDRAYTGHDAIAMVNGFISRYSEYEDLIFSIIDRNLEIRASESVINKVIPNLIPTFDVALANKFDPKRVNWDDVWLASRKLDGVRCITVVDVNGEIKCYSRQGNEFETLQVVKDAISKLGVRGIVFDGEICLMDENGNEDFQGIMKQIKRKDHTIENPKYVMFDYLTKTEFDSKESTTILTERIARFHKISGNIAHTECLGVLLQDVVSDDDHFARLSKDAETNGFEGLMLRKNVGYEGKRSQNLLKVKKFYDAEYVVESIDFENHRIIKEGKEVVVRMMGQAYITHKGYKVAVGSGWNHYQRIKYEANPDAIIGKTITVQYFEESKNQQGELSLRFPTVKHVYENGRNV